VRRGMVAVVHVDSNAIKLADPRHDMIPDHICALPSAVIISAPRRPGIV
jgi:hypothetical protein